MEWYPTDKLIGSCVVSLVLFLLCFTCYISAGMFELCLSKNIISFLTMSEL